MCSAASGRARETQEVGRARMGRAEAGGARDGVGGSGTGGAHSGGSEEREAPMGHTTR
jgi:hypothetical protein